MSTPDNKPTPPTAEDSSQPSERAKAIARRSFLRKSVGVAAPVVMTLQSGPALAIRSITCQDKTGTLEVSNPSGFTGTSAPAAGNDADVIPRLSIDPNSPDNVVNDANTLDSDPGNTSLGTQNLIRIPGNDGFARCTNTTVSTNPPTSGASFTGQPDPPGGGPWVFQGPDGSLVADPTAEMGPVAMFAIDADGENVAVGCYGDGSENLTDANGVLNRPMTNSCWSSLLS